MTPGSEARGFEFVGWKSPTPVIPAEAGIQAIPETKTNLDAGVRRHDKLSFCLEEERFQPATRPRSAKT
jgi:hypothetical protein